MNIRVLLFASYADAIGQPELPLDVPEGTRVGDVLDRVRQLAGASVLPPSPMVAVNARYATVQAVLERGDEVAIIPPVAGG